MLSARYFLISIYLKGFSGIASRIVANYFELYILCFIKRGRCYWSQTFLPLIKCKLVLLFYLNIFLCVLSSHGVLFSVHVLSLLSGVSHARGSSCTSDDLHCGESTAPAQRDPYRGCSRCRRSATGITTYLPAYTVHP